MIIPLKKILNGIEYRIGDTVKYDSCHGLQTGLLDKFGINHVYLSITASTVKQKIRVGDLRGTTQRAFKFNIDDVVVFCEPQSTHLVNRPYYISERLSEKGNIYRLQGPINLHIGALEKDIRLATMEDVLIWIKQP